MKKKIAAFLLACVLAAGLAVRPAGTVTVLAKDWQEQITEDGLAYKEDGDGIIITRCDNTNDAEIVIPQSIDGKRVTGIGDAAFYQLGNIESVRIPTGVTSIGENAFCWCSSLSDVSIPQTVESIGKYAFEGTLWLEEQLQQNNGMAYVNQILIAIDENISGSVTIPDGVAGIGSNVFSDCSSLTNISIPDSVTSIGDGAFYNCSGLSDVNLPENVTEIGSDAFYGCSGLTGIDIPNRVTSIGERAFFNCSSLSDVGIPQSVESIGGSAFNNTPWIEEQIDQNDGLVIINQNVITADDYYITDTVVIPEGVKAIAAGAFSECDLTEIHLPDSMREIGSNAFRWCSRLTDINIPDGVTSIGDSAFYGCSSLADINIPESVTEIESGVFGLCSSLVEIHLPSGLKNIGDGAFSHCSGLNNVSIPNGAVSIGDNAFSWCANLTGVSIPGSVKSIGHSAFEYTPWLTGQLRQNGGLAIVNQTIVDADAGISGNIEIPAGVTSIGDGAFSNCINLTGVRIPEGVTAVRTSAFSGCSSLRSIQIPEGVTVIEEFAFSNCSSLTGIRIPEGVTEIEEGAFVGCDSLSAISIPVSVKKIGGGLILSAFNSCPKDVYYGGSQEQWNRIWFIEFNALTSAAFHYHSSGPADLGMGKTPQFITANDITKTYSAEKFSIGAKSSGGTALSYTVSNPKVAVVDGSGTVTMKGYGITDISITAAETSAYEKAQKTIRLTVKPKKMAVSSVKSKKKKTAVVKWKKDVKATGYLIECATDKKFKKNKVKTEIKKNKTVTVTIKKLKPGKKYYMRICAYAKSGGTKVQGDWSKAKKVLVKK